MTIQIKRFYHPAFIVCALLMAVSAASKSVIINLLGIQLIKLPIELRKPLDQLDDKKLAPYVVRNRQTIANQDVLESLGTEQYIQWTLENPELSNSNPTKFCSLFITYYTGNPDMVPHVPDECYVGGGFERLKAETLSLDIPWPAKAEPLTIRFQYVLFGRTDASALYSNDSFSVQYLFKANNEFSGSRTETRGVLGGNFLGKYSYFAKIEWRFFGTDYNGMIYPTKEQTLEASKQLLGILLPVLEQDHWPDWEKANARSS